MGTGFLRYLWQTSLENPAKGNYQKEGTRIPARNRRPGAAGHLPSWPEDSALLGNRQRLDRVQEAKPQAIHLVSYEGHVRNHFGEFNSIKVSHLTSSKIEKWIAARHSSGMDVSTLKKVLVTLGQIMAYSVRHRYIVQNPVRDSERPRGNGLKSEKGIKVLSPAEIGSLLGAVRDAKYRTLFMLAIMSGARQGELLGLKWADVDWDSSQIHINRTFNNLAWYETKTKTSNRRIDLGPVMMTALKKWGLACPQSELDLMFPNDAGQPINHNNMVNRHFRPALKEAGIDRIRFHDLRHTYASLMIEQGENIKYIQTQLGHSSPTVTLNVYAHLMKSTNQEAPTRLESTLFENCGSRMVAGNEKGATAFAVTP
jgi:integrase